MLQENDGYERERDGKRRKCRREEGKVMGKCGFGVGSSSTRRKAWSKDQDV
jgi:hypothetical protein